MPNTGTTPSSPRDRVGRTHDRGGIARTVREEHAVGRAGEHVGGGRRRRHDLDAAAGRDEVAQDRPLDAEVVGDDVERRVVVADRVRRRRW